MNKAIFETLKDKLYNALDELRTDKTDTPLSSIFMELAMMDEESIDTLYNEFDNRTHVLKVMQKRLEHSFDYKLPKATLILILELGNGLTGSCLVFLYLIQRIIMVENIDPVNLDNTYSFEQFIKMFEHGFPTEESLHRFWDKQKINPKQLGMGFGSDNLIDYFSFKTVQDEQE